MKLSKIAATALLCIAGTANATVITYDDFSSTAGLSLNGATEVVNGDTLRLTPNSGSQNGSVFSTNLIDLTAGSFSSEFSFNFNSQGNGGADGIVFTLQSVSNTVGSIGGGIGYEGIPNSLGIEFDNWNNGAIDNHSDSHIGINFNGSVSSVAIATTGSLGLANLDTPTETWYAWVNYDSLTSVLDVFFNDEDVLPGTAALSYTSDLAVALGTSSVYAGFTSATGGASANHDLLSWEFSNVANGTSSLNEVPEPSSLLIFSAGLLGLIRLAKKNNAIK